MKKLFGTDGVRGKANKYPITAEIALKLGKAAAIILKKKDKKKPVFLIGKDTRLSGYMLEYALTSGLTSMGADVFLVGPIPTPAVAHLTRSFNCDAGIMISASHNPSEDNGIKFFNHQGYKLSDEIEEQIEGLVLNNELKTEHITSKEIGKAFRIEDAQGRYIEFAKGSVNNISLKGIKIALDCANGASYKVAPLIFKELGAEVITNGDKPDGNNINENCGALQPEVIKEVVLKHKADIGITLDGDADRLILVDERGNILDGDYILAIASLDFLKKGKLRKNTVVVTNYTNLAFDELIKKNNGFVIRTRNGDRYVIEEMIKNNYNLGGEYSGHIIFLDYNTTGDGIIAALQIIKIMKQQNKKLSELARILKKYPQVLINVKVKKKIPIENVKNLKEIIDRISHKLSNKERQLIRYSGTEPVLRIMLEGPDKKRIKRMAEEIEKIARKELN